MIQPKTRALSIVHPLNSQPEQIGQNKPQLSDKLELVNYQKQSRPEKSKQLRKRRSRLFGCLNMLLVLVTSKDESKKGISKRYLDHIKTSTKKPNKDTKAVIFPGDFRFRLALQRAT